MDRPAEAADAVPEDQPRLDAAAQMEFDVLPGLTVARWSTLRIPVGGLTISMHDDGTMSTDLVMETHIPMWIHWLDICFQHVKAANQAREESIQQRRQGGQEVPHESMHVEFQSSVQAVGAAAFAMEAFRNTLDDLGVVDSTTRARWKTDRTSAAQQVIETALLASSASRDDLTPDSIVRIFQARNGAVHPKVEFHEPLLHPALKMAVDRALILYGVENAHTAMTLALGLIGLTLLDARPINEEMERWVESTKRMLIEWVKERDLQPRGHERLRRMLVPDGDD